MNKLMQIVAVGITLTIIVSLGLIFDYTKNRRLYLLKKVMDTLLYILIFIFYAQYYQFFMIEGKMGGNIQYVFLIVSVIECFFALKQIKIFREAKDFRYSKMTFISVIVELIFGLTSIYFVIFMINPNWFSFDNAINNCYELAFEFLYYTFSVTITYSGSGITAIGIIPRVIQMIHILIFYIFAGDAILNYIKKE